MTTEGKNEISKFELRARAIMRTMVVFLFVLMGPMLLWLLWGGKIIMESAVILDLFKIWLGAIIGMSTNVLQKGN